MAKTIAIVTPVLDDWEALTALLADIAEALRGLPVMLHVYAVDDGSTEAVEAADIALPRHSCIVSFEIVRLAANLGHQRAIAVGLCAVVEDGTADAILVMDSDGQDRAADVTALLAAARSHPGHVVLAARARRAEPLLFRCCWRFYRLMFRALAGRAIDFGNFSLIPAAAARRLVHMPDLWNHLAAAIMRSRLPCVTVPTARAARSCGGSRMNLAALVVHGLSAMSVYCDVILVRVLLAAATLAGIAGLGIAAVVTIRIATSLAVPGWATAAAGDLLIVMLQIVAIATAASLSLLARRNSRPILPALDCAAFIAARDRRRTDRPGTVVALARPVA
jgi:glycosyltransferase involved in cell wall biosynthesis